MKKTILLAIFAAATWVCSAQQHFEHFITQQNHESVLFMLNPEFCIRQDSEILKAAGYQVYVPAKFKKDWTFHAYKVHQSFLRYRACQIICIQTPFIYCDSCSQETPILQISDDDKITIQSVPIDTVRERLYYYNLDMEANKGKHVPFLTKKKNRVNQIVQNDGLVIYLINIKPKNLDFFRKLVTKPISTN